MKILYLIRHAKARKDSGIADIERPLAKEGKEQISLIGKRLKKYKVISDIIYSSPAKRALDTAKRIARIVSFPVERIEVVESIYASSVPRLLKIIKKIDDLTGSVMLFGHNPEFFDLANYLASSRIDKFPTCGAFCLEFDIKSWDDLTKNIGKVVFFECP